MKEEKIFYENGSDRIAAILHSPDNQSRKAVILLHGFTGDKDTEGGSNLFPVLAKNLCKEGFNVLRFDCRGSNESDGKFEDMTFTSEVSDLEKSIEFMRGKGTNRIAVIGCSFGGAVTLLAYKNNVDCIVLWYPLIYPQESKRLAELLSRKREFDKEGKIVITNSQNIEFVVGKRLFEEWQIINPDAKLKEIKCPILIVVGTNDRALSLKNAERAMKEIRATKNLEIVNGAHHCWKNANNELVEDYRRQAMKATIYWIKEWL